MDISDDQILETYARHEAELESGEYLTYREVLAGALRGVGTDLGFEPSREEVEQFSGSVADWPPFPDSSEALHRLHERFRLAPITNCDDDLFAASARRLGVDFDWVITAQQARSYKPSENNFELAFERIGVPRERILHVAQSLFHDHVTAKRLGMTTVWVDRRHGRGGSGATPPAEAPRPHRAGHAHAGGPRRGLEEPGQREHYQRKAEAHAGDAQRHPLVAPEVRPGARSVIVPLRGLTHPVVLVAHDHARPYPDPRRDTRFANR